MGAVGSELNGRATRLSAGWQTLEPDAPARCWPADLGGSVLWGPGEGRPWANDKEPTYKKVLVYRNGDDAAPVALDLGKTAANKLFVRGGASWMNRTLSANLCHATEARKALGLLGLAEGHRVRLGRHPLRAHGPDAFVVQLVGAPEALPEAEKKPAGAPGLPGSPGEDAPRRKRGRPPKLADGIGAEPREPAAKKEVSAWIVLRPEQLHTHAPVFILVHSTAASP